MRADRLAVAGVPSIAERWEPCHLDDLPCLLNPVRAMDLKQILLLSPPEIRVDMALTFCRKTRADLQVVIGLAPEKRKVSASYMSIYRYLVGSNAMPMGIAFRMEKAFGVPASLLCEWYV